MNNSFPRLIDGMCATLRSEVLTRLDDDFARGQVFGVINLLNTFKARADWSATFLVQQLEAQCEGLNKASAAASASGLELAVDQPAAIVPTVTATSELLAQRDALNHRIVLCLDWLAKQRNTISEDQALAIEAPLRLAMRREIEIELKHSPRPLFAEMSSGNEN